MTCELLLQEISAISEKHRLIYQQTGGYFNIFDIAGIRKAEVTLCRVLRELLDPRGSHFQGSGYLELFVRHVLCQDLGQIDWRTVRVYREFVIDERRRIDLVIAAPGLFIPIEVKIDAEDQQNQCADYCKKAYNEITKEKKMYYLTKDGRPPSPASAGNQDPWHSQHPGPGNPEIIGSSSIGQISFKTEILNWLYLCLEYQNTQQIAPIREILLQLIGFIRNLTNQLEDKMRQDIVDLLTSSRTHMQSAIDIMQSLDACKRKIIIAVFAELDKHMQSTNIGGEPAAVRLTTGLAGEYDYAYNGHQLVDKIIGAKPGNFPGISYFCKTLKKSADGNDDIDLWFRIEIEWRIYAGFYIPLKDQKNGAIISSDDLHDVLKYHDLRDNSRWAYFEYLPDSEIAHSPNFIKLNHEYLDLYDSVKFAQFIERSVKHINGLLENLNRSKN